MNISKRELVLKIARARAVADECHKKYNKDGSKYPFLAGAYEGVFAELLGVRSFDALLEKVDEK